MHHHLHSSATSITSFCPTSSPIQQQQQQLPNLTHFQQQREQQQQLPGAYPHNRDRTPFGQARARLGLAYYWGSKQVFANMNNQYNTNPVGALQERYQSRGITPQYNVIQTDGASHCPTFCYNVCVGDFSAAGSGSSKKQAKHNAARALLDKLDGRITVQEMIPPLPPAAPAPPPDTLGVPSSSPGITKGNTIGQLQEMCVKKGLPMPVYALGNVLGQPHQRSFTIKVTVGTYEATGEGTSKKDAKREAASNLMDLFNRGDNGAEGLSPNVTHKLDKSTEDELLTKTEDCLKIDTLKPEDSNKIQKFYKNLKQGSESKLAILNRTPLRNIRGGDYITVLKEIAAEQQFEVTHVEIDERTEDGEVQCLVQISSLPVAVCYGVGYDSASANQNAAKHALDYLKLMTKKSGGSKNSQANVTLDPQQQNGNTIK